MKRLVIVALLLAGCTSTQYIDVPGPTVYVTPDPADAPTPEIIVSPSPYPVPEPTTIYVYCPAPDPNGLVILNPLGNAGC